MTMRFVAEIFENSFTDSVYSEIQKGKKKLKK